MWQSWRQGTGQCGLFISSWANEIFHKSLGVSVGWQHNGRDLLFTFNLANALIIKNRMNTRKNKSKEERGSRAMM